MERIIKAAVDRGASDLHIKAGDVFRARIHGKLVPLTKQALTPDQTRTIALHLMSNEDDKARLDTLTDYDCSWAAPGVGRFRVNILKQRSSFMIVMRVIPFEVPTFEKLRLPPALERVAEAERGMVLVTGVTGSGKSSTMAAMVNFINQHEAPIGRHDLRDTRRQVQLLQRRDLERDHPQHDHEARALLQDVGAKAPDADRAPRAVVVPDLVDPRPIGLVRDDAQRDRLGLVRRQRLLRQRTELAIDPRPEDVPRLDVDVRRATIHRRLDDLLHHRSVALMLVHDVSKGLFGDVATPVVQEERQLPLPESGR